MSAPLLLIDGCGFDRASWDLVVETIDATLSRFISTQELEFAFYLAEESICVSVTARLRKIVRGQEKVPRNDDSDQELRCNNQMLDATSRIMIEDALVCALAPLVTTEDVVSALEHQDWFVFTGAGGRVYLRRFADKKSKRHD